MSDDHHTTTFTDDTGSQVVDDITGAVISITRAADRAKVAKVADVDAQHVTVAALKKLWTLERNDLLAREDLHPDDRTPLLFGGPRQNTWSRSSTGGRSGRGCEFRPPSGLFAGHSSRSFAFSGRFAILCRPDV